MMSSRTYRAAASLAALSLLVVAGCADDTPTAPNLSRVKPGPAPVPVAPPAQYIVLYNDDAAGLADPTSASGVRLGKMRHMNGEVFAYVADPDALRDDPNVASVTENFISYPTADPYPIDALYFKRNWQWSMQQIRAHEVPISVQGEGTRVCIIDSGIDESHQDLAGRVVARTSFVDQAHGYPGPGESPAPLDSNGHGSHVASTVSTNGIGVAPVAPGAQLMTAKIFPATGGASLAAIWDGIAWCAENDADVINMSLGGVRARPLSATNVELKQIYTDVIAEAREAGTVVVVSSGNDNLNMDPGSPQETWPAQIEGTVTVSSSAATSSMYYNFPFAFPAPHPGFDTRASYSNYGVDADIWAPGGTNFINRPQSNIIGACSSYRNNGACAGGTSYMSIGGTSMASPHVAGVAALITSRLSTPKGLARTEQVESCLYETGDPITILGVTRPRLNAYRAATEDCGTPASF